MLFRTHSPCDWLAVDDLINPVILSFGHPGYFYKILIDISITQFLSRLLIVLKSDVISDE